MKLLLDTHIWIWSYLEPHPADRLLVATAKTYEMTLVTADQQLMNVPGIDVLPNR